MLTEKHGARCACVSQMPIVENLGHLDDAGAVEHRRRTEVGLLDASSRWSPPDLHEREATDVCVLPVLSIDEIETVLSVVHNATAADGRAFDFAYSDSHVVMFLHRDGLLQRTKPALYDRVVSVMNSHLGHWDKPLCVRCIEFHACAPHKSRAQLPRVRMLGAVLFEPPGVVWSSRYTAGGGLLNPGHRDKGSVLSMSVLLSSPDAVLGGQFVTWTDGGTTPVAHAVGQGDGVIFFSEKLHNVNTIASGRRLSLVLELWEGGTNTFDRHR